ncbi:MAG: DUF1634 domain-containing protein [Chloroflexota bacterium]
MSRPEISGGSLGSADLDGIVARLLRVGTHAAVGLIALGVLLLLRAGASPLDPAPSLAIGQIADDLGTLEPAGFLWLGLLVVLLTPTARVVVSAVGYARLGDRRMAVIAVLVLAVVGAGIIVGAQGG